jgi:hypothetical protein
VVDKPKRTVKLSLYQLHTLYNNPGSVVTSDNDGNYLEVGPASETAFSTGTGIQFFSEHDLLDYCKTIFDSKQVFFNKMRRTLKSFEPQIYQHSFHKVK